MDSSRPVYLPSRGRGRGRGYIQSKTTNRSPGYTKQSNSDSDSQSPTSPQSLPNPVQFNWSSNQPATGHTSPSGAMSASDSRFHLAAARHKESADRLMDEETLESSEEEEELNDGDIMQTLLKTYHGSLGGETGDLGRTSEYLTNSVKSKASVCLICISSVKREDPIWCCKCCYTAFHISCLQKWIKDGIYQSTAFEEDNSSHKTVPWNCPKCRFEYQQSSSPRRYFCYCGKEEDPKFDPWLVPHSCGQMCGQRLQPECGHSCLLLCHPGPCPPCPQTVKTQCYCGAQAPQIRRCGAKLWSCAQPCKKPLKCGHHACTKPCHAGECPPCPFTSFQPCLCGMEQQERPCATPDWHCDRVCNKALSCGHHTCERVCHAADCGECPRAGRRSCPCGKTKLEIPCTEDVPTCLETCEKTLECGLHPCKQRCHTGPCGTCRDMIVKACRCGKKKKELQCFKEYLCDTKCNEMKDCKKHPCKRKCCGGNCPPCELQCTKSLRCRNHKCSSRCHLGPCYPCPENVTLACNCRATTVTVPCGREKVTRPPKCNKPCRSPPECHHPSRSKHRCHKGRCPPCTQICSKQLAGCTHSCPATCHSAVLTKVTNKVVRAGPWEAAPEVREELVNQSCPPCQVPVPVSCLGKHETVKFPCHLARVASCGRPCGRTLTCGNHICSLQCHQVEDALDSQTAGSSCQKCEEGCSKPRPEGCTHSCLLTCHQNDCPPCQQMVRMRCHCQLVLQHIECDSWTHADDTERERLKSCGCQCPKTLSCGHQCKLLCHAVACPKPDRCVEKVKVKCPCKRKKGEFLCNEVYLDDATVTCDELCEEIKVQKKKEKEEEEQQRHLEEEKRQQLEYEEFQRRLQGKKRKKRKPRTEEEQPTFLHKYGKYIIAPTLVVGLAVFIFYLIQVSQS